MYRIELKPGEENVFRTLEELATGIRNGLVTPRARIFHNASQKWLPIEFHPHYKKALAMPPTKSGETPAVGVKKSSETHAHPSNRSKVVEIPSAVAPPPGPAPAPVPAPAPGPVARTRELTFIPTDPPKPAPAPEPVVAQAPPPVREKPPAAVMSPVVDLPTISHKDTAKDTARRAEPVRHTETPRHAETPRQVETPRPVETARHVETVHHDDHVPHHEPVRHEDSSLPVAHQPLTRTEVRRIKPVYLGAIAAVLIVGSYVALSAATPSTKTQAAQETPKPEPVVAPPLPPPAGYDPSADSIPTHRAALGTATTSGPTFGGLPAPAAPKAPIVTSVGASPAAPSAKDSSASIEPAPAAVDLSVPSLPSGDSLAPTLSDTGGMRRILRAVGGKGAPDARP